MFDRKGAEKIALDFLNSVNPYQWDGAGEKPDYVSTLIHTYDFQSKFGNELDISLEKDEGKWTHYCELRDKETGDLLAALHGYSVDSYLNLADTIMDICREA